MHLAMTKEEKVVVRTEGGVDVGEAVIVDGELEVEDDGDLDV
jgi:hypothetical protein